MWSSVQGKRSLVIPVLVLLATTGATTGVAHAATSVGCGQTISANTTLTADVGPCDGDGIVVGADGITLNLNGHRVFGTPDPDDNVGIRLFRRTGVTVTGGDVSQFGAGVAIQGGSDNVVRRVRAHDNVGFIDGSGDFGDGVAIFNSIDNLVSDSTIAHNGPFDGVGVFGARSTGNRLDRNVVQDNNIARYSRALGLFLNLDDGVNLGAGLEGGSHTRVTRNSIRRNGLNGVDACSIRGNPCITTDNVISQNEVQGNGFGDPSHPEASSDIGDGIHVVSIVPPGMNDSDFFPSTRDLVVENEVFHNGGDGIVVGTSENRILRNQALGNGSAIEDFFFDLEDQSPDGDCDANVWRANEYGIAVPECTTAPHPGATPSVAAPLASSSPPANPLPTTRKFPPT